MKLVVDSPSTVSATQEMVDDIVLDILPRQGAWTEEAYLWLTDHTNRLLEYTDGHLEVLPMPTDKHQAVLKYLFLIFVAVIEPLGGAVRFAPLRLRIRERKYREPDLLLVRAAGDPRRQDRYWLGADLVLEVVSADKPERDRLDKREDYAEAHVPEYWIVDLPNHHIVVLRLDGNTYVEHGVFGPGVRATSALLPNLAVDVDAVLNAD